ncbi:hypothetical protein JTB14_033087 [Gonioctena quinquepunctata]|nr:hypothetical protein JTB14_033087 [Gonioctena quinquepunctata]
MNSKVKDPRKNRRRKPECRRQGNSATISPGKDHTGGSAKCNWDIKDEQLAFRVSSLEYLREKSVRRAPKKEQQGPKTGLAKGQQNVGKNPKNQDTTTNRLTSDTRLQSGKTYELGKNCRGEDIQNFIKRAYEQISARSTLSRALLMSAHNNSTECLRNPVSSLRPYEGAILMILEEGQFFKP